MLGLLFMCIDFYQIICQHFSRAHHWAKREGKMRQLNTLDVGPKELKMRTQEHEACWVDAGKSKLVPQPLTFMGVSLARFLTIKCPHCDVRMWRYARADKEKCAVCNAERTINVSETVAFCVICHRQDSVDA